MFSVTVHWERKPVLASMQTLILPLPGKQINLLMKGLLRREKGRGRRRGWRKMKLRRGKARIRTPNRLPWKKECFSNSAFRKIK